MNYIRVVHQHYALMCPKVIPEVLLALVLRIHPLLCAVIQGLFEIP